MNKPTVKCALLGTLVANHCWGSPLDEDSLLSMSKIADHKYPRAREVLNKLRTEPYVCRRGKRGFGLASDGFGHLADVLYHDCNWDSFEIKSRLKHYEGWNDHGWA